jgi:alkyldihydroxyacetonephosphate synthase
LPPREFTPVENLEIPPSMISPDDVAELERLAGEGNVSLEHRIRATHATGRGYKDLVRLRSGTLERAPDAVLFPTDEDSVALVLDFAGRRRFAVVPFGGGTSVVGGVDPPTSGDFAAVLVLDLRRMRRIIGIDEESGLVIAEAGIRGPLLEEALNAKGLTLGHFPQSWEFSTVGGWLATRATGAFSNRYGRIEGLVAGLHLVAPTRKLELGALPGRAHGPDLKELVLGSEGTLGIITQATLRAHPLPAAREFASRLFRSFAEGLAALRAMARDGSLPDMAYLSDEEETRFLAASSGIDPDTPTGAGLKILGARGYSLSNGSALLMAFEGSPTRVAHRAKRALGLATPSADLGSAPASRSYEERFATPYLRDSLLDHGILIDTVETAAPWSLLPSVHEVGEKALRETLWKAGTAGLVLCHVSHAYPDGASLYFTFLGKQLKGREIEQWEKVKGAVTDAFLEAGAALSHHHGIGVDHARYLGRVVGEDGLVVLRALKRELDPQGIMNPGKLIPVAQ